MNINKMSRKAIESLPYIDAFEKNLLDVDSIVLLPTRRMDGLNGYRLYEVVPCLNCEPLGKLCGYDTFSIFMKDNHNRVGIDCLGKSGLMRIFLEHNKYEINCLFHEITKKEFE